MPPSPPHPRPRPRQHALVLLGLVLTALMLPGCIPEAKPGFDSPAPSKRIDAIVNASTLKDDESLVKLVEKLRSPDPAERMFAIRSLEIRTGQTFGYDHAAEHWKRIEAYNRWVRYLEQDRGIQVPGAMKDQEMGVKDDDHPNGEEDEQHQPMEENAG